MLASGEAANLIAVQLVEGRLARRFREAVERAVMIEALALKVARRSAGIGTEVMRERFRAVILGKGTGDGPGRVFRLPTIKYLYLSI